MLKKKVLILGSKGYLGGALTRHLLARGYTVIGLDNNLRERNVKEVGSESITPITDFFTAEIDISKDYIGLRNIIDFFEPDSIVHLAEQPSAPFSMIDAEHAAETQRNNVIGTMNVLWAIKETNPDIHLIKLGTAGEYPDWLYNGIEVPEGSRIQVQYQGKDWTIPTPRYAGSWYHFCYDDKTEILTRDGWKLFSELKNKEEVATLNQDTQELEYQNIINSYSFNYKGKLYRQKNRRLDVAVTPNHKMFTSFSRKDGKLNNPKLIEAEKLYGRYHNYLVSAEYKNSDSDVVSPFGREIDTDNWLHFMGWYLSEGSVNKKGSRYQVTLYSNNNVDGAVEAFRGIGIEPSRSNEYSRKGDKELALYLRQFGNSCDKFIPKDLKQLSGERLKILLSSLIAGGGTNNNKGWVYYTSSKKLADDVQEVALKCGYSAGVYRVNRNIPNKLGKLDEYRVNICRTKTVQVNLGKNNSYYEDYNGVVFCCEVPNGVILVRRNGKPFFSGNSKLHDSNNIDYACRIWGLRATDLNQGIVYGHIDGTRFDYDQYFGTVVNRFVSQMVVGMPLTIYGEGTQTRSFINIKNSIEAIKLMIDNSADEGEFRVIHQLTETHRIIDIAKMVGGEIKTIDNPRAEMVKNEFKFEAKKLKTLGLETIHMEDEIPEMIKTITKYKDKINKSVIMPTTTWK